MKEVDVDMRGLEEKDEPKFLVHHNKQNKNAREQINEINTLTRV